MPPPHFTDATELLLAGTGLAVGQLAKNHTASLGRGEGSLVSP